MSKRFQRTIEDFVCGNCGAKIHGNGYTNHCPKCLWSKHVDNFPGDREAECGGMMKPVGAVKKKSEYFIVHRCVKCGFERQKKLEKNDDFSVLISLTKQEN